MVKGNNVEFLLGFNRLLKFYLRGHYSVASECLLLVKTAC